METSILFTDVNWAEWQILTEFEESAVEKLKRGPTSISAWAGPEDASLGESKRLSFSWGFFKIHFNFCSSSADNLVPASNSTWKHFSVSSLLIVLYAYEKIRRNKYVIHCVINQSLCYYYTSILRVKKIKSQARVKFRVTFCMTIKLSFNKRSNIEVRKYLDI